jgi:hypothetical protein
VRVRRHAILLAVTVALTASATAVAQTPQALILALQKAKVSQSDLPHGYTTPLVGAYKVTAEAKKHGAVGGVQIFMDGGKEGIIYLVFRTPALAKADWKHASFNGAKPSSAPASIPKPSVVVDTSGTGSAGGKTITFGLTEVAALSGNVIVQAVTASTASKTHGDRSGALLLAAYALRHLTAAR